VKRVGYLAAALIAGAFSLSLAANPLGNDCAIVATEANARLATSAIWSQIIFIRFLDFKNLSIAGHALTVWQIHDGGVILIYDENGAVELETHSRVANDIAAALNKRNPRQPIFAAHFVQ
jgi:hypothetical protein